MSNTNPFPTQPQPPAIQPNQQASLKSDTFSDLISLQAPSMNSTLPLQFQPTSSFGQQLQAQLGSPVVSTPTGTNPYANLTATTPTGAGPAFPSTFDRSPNLRSASLPVYGQQTGAMPLTMMSTGMGTNPFQQQGFGVGTPPAFSSPPTGPSAPNPFNTQFGMQAQQQQQMFSPTAFSPQPQPAGMGGTGGGMLQATPSPFRQSPSPFATTTPTGAFQASPQPSQMQMQAPMQQHLQSSFSSPFPGASPASNSPYAQQAQQAQQLFQNMQAGGSSNNPFGRQWG